MKEIILRSKKFPNLVCQIFNGNEFGMLGENEKKRDDDLYIDNKEYVYEIFKLLREAEKRNCFEDKKSEEKEEDIEEILI